VPDEPATNELWATWRRDMARLNEANMAKRRADAEATAARNELDAAIKAEKASYDAVVARREQELRER
jgi:hypothetical protein